MMRRTTNGKSERAFRPIRDLRAVVYGVGKMGSILTRLLLDKSVKIVAVLGERPEVAERGVVAARREGVDAGFEFRPVIGRGRARKAERQQRGEHEPFHRGNLVDFASGTA